ncbi:1-phosphatidylinositol 4,5-bisphosphate phosphodiesterase classes I and II-like [Babylonia areolata]|uniref:1-phosphatidylinositol 4,5-bisphosphate phosphodiesterase classes I and II-like n=1 Tax=Babylonia areolata TaxID=304850 RepID=UPI003FD36B3A
MASARTVHIVQLKPNVVPDTLINGSKLIMWNDNSSVGTPVTLKVDEKGTILFWRDMMKEMDYLDIALIKDTRTGKYVKLPKDSKLRESLNIGQKNVPLEDKAVSIGWSTDMFNIEWLNFVCSDRDTAKLWADELLAYSVNLLNANSSSLCFLEKWYTRVTSVLSTDGRVPLKNFVKQVATHKDDKKKVEQALQAAGIAIGKNDTLDPAKLTFEQFFTFYCQLTTRTEIDTIFAQTGAKKKPYLTLEQFTDFLNREQRDPRLNEVLYPLTSEKQAQELISNHEAKSGMASKGHLSQEGFLKFLLSEDNNVIPHDKLDLNEDMNQPLAHYFINSSHNTYLTGHQFTGKSSVEIYRQVLLSGCRCIELDCWDGKGQDEEPVITHGYTMCTEVLFKDVVEAIAESAFKTSEYPVILSFENHCGPRQQAKMANYCRAMFGEMLLDAPLDSHPLKPDVPLPSPAELKRRIIVKNKKKHFHKTAEHAKSSPGPKAPKAAESSPTKTRTSGGEAENEGGGEDGEGRPGSTTGEGDAETPMSPSRQKSSGGGDATASDAAATASPEEKTAAGGSEGDKGKPGEPQVFPDSDTDDSDSEDEDAAMEMSEEEKKRRERMEKEKGTAGKEAEAAMEMSLLVNYVQPVHFHSFEASEKRNKSFEISSFVETQALNLLKESPVDFVNYNKRQLSRIYPKGTRVDSSNFLPQVYWNAGCQLVALNFQTLDLAMQINLGTFEYNGRTGYILKPDFMRRVDRHFDPFAESTVDGIVAGTLTIKIISGQFLSDKRVGTYVEVDMYGLPTDTVRKRFRTKTIPNNGLNPVYDEDPFVFKKVVLPNLAILRLSVYEEAGKLIGHRIMPVEGLRPGFRHIPLRNECNQTLPLQAIFVHILINDYIPDALAGFADALLNPIAYISQLDKHAQQLEVLTEDFEAEAEEEKKDEAGDSLPNTAIKDMGEKMQKRQNSVISRGSGSVVDMSPTVENKALPVRASIKRAGSSHQVGLTKQDSVHSVNSQGSSGSGKMLKVSDANLQLLLCGNLNRMTSSAYLGENGTGTFAQNSKLNDADILTPTPLDELKTSKPYMKVVAKRDKELDNMRRKFDKSRDVTDHQQQGQVDKLIVSQTKARMSLEKAHTKTLKKMAKCGDNTEDKKQVFKGEMETLLQAQAQELHDMRYRHADTLRRMDCEHFQAEAEVLKRHHTAVYDALFEVLGTNHSTHKKSLQDIHDRDVVHLKKAMDPQIRDHMKQLAKKHKDKQELARIKREAQQKHVQAVVSEIQRVDDLLAKRMDDLTTKLQEIQKAAEKERDESLTNYQEECDQKCQKAQDTFDAVVKELKPDEEEEPEDNNADNTTVANGPTENGPVVENGPVENGPVENGPTDNSSPARGPHITTIIVNSPAKEGAKQDNSGDEKKDNDEKAGSQEVLADH